MLKQYDFAFRCTNLSELQSDPGVKLQGQLMHEIPTETAQEMHEKTYHPYSLYCVKTNENTVVTRISALTEEGDVLLTAAQKMKTVNLAGVGQGEILRRGEIQTFDVQKIAESLTGKKFRMLFLTPSSFKSGGRETGMPDISMHFVSVLRKMRQFEQKDVNLQAFREMLYQCRFSEWNLTQEKFRFRERNISGMTGYVDIELPPHTETAQQIKEIFVYASFCGTGGKTGMGMGGFFLEPR